MRRASGAAMVGLAQCTFVPSQSRVDLASGRIAIETAGLKRMA